jgi:acetyl-CoA carboxylase biotin carboxyl carrier protein
VSDDLPLSPEDVEQIVAILSKSNYQTLEIETARFRLRVAKAGERWTQEWTPAGGQAAPVGASAQVETQSGDDGLLAVTAPLPGAFYRSPQPGAPPFVEVGHEVAPDTVVAIIETMKLMTPVHAGVHGRITEIIPRNAEHIEAHAVLMKVQPA